MSLPWQTKNISLQIFFLQIDSMTKLIIFPSKLLVMKLAPDVPQSHPENIYLGDSRKGPQYELL